MPRSLLPPGEKAYQLAIALGVIDRARLERLLIERMWRLRTDMTIRQIREHLGKQGVSVSIGWLTGFYQDTKHTQPDAA